MPNTHLQGFRLSPQQRRIWWLQKTADGTQFQVQAVVRIEGRIEGDRLKSAVRALVTETEILRTTFRRLGGMSLPLQVINDDLPPVLRERQLAGLATEEQQQAIQALFREEWEAPYDPERDSPLRVLWIEVGPQLSLLVLSVSGFCADRTGIVNLAAAIACTYQNGKASPTQTQYVELAEWQNELLECDEARIGRKHWETFQIQAAAGLGCEAPDSKGRSVVPGSVPVPIAMATAARLKQLGEEDGLPVPIFILAAWILLLDRWRPLETPLLGLACDGRRYREMATIIGPFARVLPVGGVPGSASLRTAARQLEPAARQARAFQESFDWEGMPGVKSGEASGFAYLPWVFSSEEEQIAVSTASATFTVESVRDNLERFDLHLATTFRDAEIVAQLRYNQSRFDVSDVERLAALLTAFLERLTQNPGIAATNIPMMGDADAVGRPVVSDALCVHHVFSRQAERTPDAVAVACDEVFLTYGELARRSDQIASCLRAMAVGPEVRVALYTERSADTILGMLGILKAGGAFVPLEPGEPQPRMARMLESVSPAVVLTQWSLAGGVPSGSWLVRCLEDIEKVESMPAAPLSCVTPHNLAYVLFTSGTTGQPKGVAIEHRHLLNYVLAVTDRFGFTQGEIFATVTTLAADLSYTMIFPSLCCGGCLRIVTLDQARDAEALADLFERHPIDCLKVTPSHLSALLHASRSERIVPLRLLVLGGEALRRDLLRQVSALAPGCHIYNHYGPTETTVGVLTHAYVEGEWDNRWATFPVGRTLGEAHVSVLDANHQEAPCWAEGELYIGGATVARGYLGQPALTAERFIPNPARGAHGERLYSTGDRVRHWPATGVEFLGRMDHQVKIRGFRIEPGEIDAQIRLLPEVCEALVLAREDEPGEKRLVAYVVPSADADPSIEAIRKKLATQLPEHMLPAAFVILPSFPLSANGKIDRSALPAPNSTALRGAPVAPRTPIEELLIGFWMDLLGREDIGVDDNFFELGGHSLLATQLFSRIRQVFDADLPLSLLFDSPTVSGLAAGIEAALKKTAGVQIPPILPTPRRPFMPLSFSQRRHWILQQLDSSGSLYNIRGTLRMQGNLDVALLERCVREVIRRHEVLRTSFPVIDRQPVQEISPTYSFHLPVVDLQGLPAGTRNETMRALVKQARERSFDLTQLPLFRYVVLRLAEDEHLLVVALHHIIADGWSLGILIREVTTFYRALAEDLPLSLPPLAIQYADFSEWQHQLVRNGMMAAHLDYWRRQLADCPRYLRLPFDFPRPPVPSAGSLRQKLEIPPQLSQSLRVLARLSGATLFQVLLASFQVLLYGYSRQTDIVIGAPVANRNHLATEGLIGCLINALPLRGDLSGDPSFRQLLARVRKVVIEAHNHQDLPFDRLVKEINPSRSGALRPFFQVVFSYGMLRPPILLPGLTITPLDVETEVEAKYDLILCMAPTEDSLTGALVYSTDLFRPATAAMIANRFSALLHNIAARPDAALSELVAAVENSERIAALERVKGLRQGRSRVLRRAAGPAALETNPDIANQ